MGQPIAVSGTTVAGEIAAFDTDRGITGQDGVGFDSATDANEAAGLAGGLASRIFAADGDVFHVFVASSQVVVGRTGAWTKAELAAVADVIAGFFVVYDDVPL